MDNILGHGDNSVLFGNITVVTPINMCLQNNYIYSIILKSISVMLVCANIYIHTHCNIYSQQINREVVAGAAVSNIKVHCGIFSKC